MISKIYLTPNITFLFEPNSTTLLINDHPWTIEGNYQDHVEGQIRNRNGVEAIIAWFFTKYNCEDEIKKRCVGGILENIKDYCLTISDDLHKKEEPKSDVLVFIDGFREAICNYFLSDVSHLSSSDVNLTIRRMDDFIRQGRNAVTKKGK